MVNVSLRTLTEDYFAARLTRDAESLLAGIFFAADRQPIVPEDHVNPIFNRAFSGRYYEVISEGFVVRSRSLLDYSLDVKPVAAGQFSLTRISGPENRPLILLVTGYQKRGRLLTIAVAEDYSPIEGEFFAFQWRFVLITSGINPPKVQDIFKRFLFDKSSYRRRVIFQRVFEMVDFEEAYRYNLKISPFG